MTDGINNMNLDYQQNEYKKNNLYRDYYRLILKGLVIFTISACALSLWLVWLYLKAPKPEYYATTTNGELVRLHSLSEPVVTTPYVLQWASTAVRQAYNINFSIIDSQLEQMKSNFTPQAWQAFNDSIHKSGLIDSIIQQKLIMSAVVSGPPVVLAQMIRHGRFTWSIQLPLLVTFDSASAQSKRNMIIDVNVSRVPVITDPVNIQISDFAVVG